MIHCFDVHDYIYITLNMYNYVVHSYIDSLLCDLLGKPPGMHYTRHNNYGTGKVLYRNIAVCNTFHSPAADHELVDGSGTSRRWRLAVT